jgi:hypothetical protein
MLSGGIIEVSTLSANDRHDMAELMDRHYANFVVESFESDLAEKQWVIQVFDPITDRLCGFSTQMLLNADTPSGPIRALFSGDTIVDRQYWGESTLMRLGGQLAMRTAEAFPGERLYWFLISQGFRTYRWLPVFFNEFYPRFDRSTPEEISLHLDALAKNKFGDRYDQSRKIVRRGPNDYCLRPGLGEITPQRIKDAHVRYFTEQNPGHTQGDELCCLAHLSVSNLTPAARRLVNQP